MTDLFTIEETSKLANINNETIDNLNNFYHKDIVNSDNFKVKYFDERYFAIYPIKNYNESLDIIYISNLSKNISKYNISTSSDTGILYNINNNFTNLITEPLDNTYLFMEINNPTELDNIPEADYNKLIRKIPSGNYLDIKFNKENLGSTINKISKYLKKNNFKINEVIELTLFDNIFAHKEHNCEFQILLK